MEKIQVRKDIEQYKDPERVEGDAIQIRSNGIVFTKNGASVLLKYQKKWRWEHM